jgi:hypothetical protein
MLFSFDVVMIDKNFKVVSLKELVKPFRVIFPKLRAESVIELPAHTIFRSRTEIGDELVIDRTSLNRNSPARGVRSQITSMLLSVLPAICAEPRGGVREPAPAKNSRHRKISN